MNYLLKLSQLKWFYLYIGVAPIGRWGGAWPPSFCLNKSLDIFQKTTLPYPVFGPPPFFLSFVIDPPQFKFTRYAYELILCHYSELIPKFISESCCL